METAQSVTVPSPISLAISNAKAAESLPIAGKNSPSIQSEFAGHLSSHRKQSATGSAGKHFAFSRRSQIFLLNLLRHEALLAA